MTTLKLKVSDRVLEKVRQTLEQFGSDEVQIIEERSVEFDQNKNELNEELVRYESGAAKTYSIEQADSFLEETIKRHES